MTSQPGWQTISIHILTIISRSEGSHTMKCGQLIEYNTRNIFLEKSYPKCGGNLFSDPFLKNQNWANSGSIVCFIKSVFIVCQVEDYRNILKLSFRPLAFTSNKAFKKNKKRSGTSLPALFSTWFLKKSISFVIFYLLPDQFSFFFYMGFLSRTFTN